MDFSTYPANWYNSFALIFAQTASQVSLFLPRLVGALLVLILGAFVAKFLKRVVVKVFDTLKISQGIKNTPIEHFVSNAEVGQKIEEILGSIVYWLVMLLIVQTSVTILGLEPLSAVLNRIINYLPNIIAAVLVLFFGTLLAGVLESVVKGSIKTIDGRSSRILGKVASYLVISITLMAAVSELGIASEFIMILFIGLVAMVTLGAGLAIGLGGQDLVRKMLSAWYEKTLKEVRE